MTGRLVGLGGRQQSGKDTVAAHLIAEHGFVKVAFADPLRAAALALDPWVPINAASKTGSLYVSSGDFVRYSRLLAEVGYEKAKENPEVRELLQHIGTEVGRRILGENVWTDAARRRIQELREAGTSVVVTDTRFPNEVALIEDLGGDSVYVYRPEAEQVPATHASETSVSSIDFNWVLDNTGSLADLYLKTDHLVRHNIAKEHP